MFTLNDFSAAARFFHQGDKIIVMGYCLIDEVELKTHKPKIAIVDEKNQITTLVNHESAGAFSA